MRIVFEFEHELAQILDRKTTEESVWEMNENKNCVRKSLVRIERHRETILNGRNVRNHAEAEYRNESIRKFAENK